MRPDRLGMHLTMLWVVSAVRLQLRKEAVYQLTRPLRTPMSSRITVHACLPAATLGCCYDCAALGGGRLYCSWLHM